MTQSFTFREPVSHDLGPQPTMQHYNLMPNDGIMLERPGQKRRREIGDFGLLPGNDASTGPPTVGGSNFCDLVAAQPSLAIEKQSFLDRMIHSARSGRFPLTGAGAVAPFEPIGHHNVADPAAAAHVARFRSGRTLESTAAAAAQAMANFQALIDEGRRSSNLFQAYDNGQSNHGYGAPSFLSVSETGPQSSHGYGSAPSFRAMQTGSEYDQLNYGYGAPWYNSSQNSFSAGTGFGGNGHMNGETNWPNLTCHTSSSRSLFASTATPQSPRTPRNNSNTVLSDAHQEYLNHMERINAIATDPESPHQQRGRTLAYAESDVHVQAEKHVHIYLDEEDLAPEHVDDWGATEFTVGFGAVEAPEDAPAPVVAPPETEKFDLNEVPVGYPGEAATPKPRKKYHPRVAKDKRTYKRRVDGKKTPASPAAVDGFAHSSSPAKSKFGKRSSDQPHSYAINDELSGRDAASHSEVVDMDIEYNGSFSHHNTAVCDCEACIKLRLERRMQQQSPKSPPQQRTWHHDQSTTFSESPPVRRTLFHAPQPRQDHGPDARRSLACFDPPQQRSAARLDPEAATRRSLACFDPPPLHREMVPHHTTAYSAVKSFFTPATSASTSSCLQQFDESAALLGMAQRSLRAAIVPASRVSSSNNSLSAAIVPASRVSSSSNNSSFMSRLCPRGILSPQTVSFREMNLVQRIMYLRAILNSSNQMMMSPESLLRHVHEHLPESEKQEFKEVLWPIVLSDLTSDQEKHFRDFAQLEQPDTCTALEVVKRTRGPNKVKKSPPAVKPARKGSRKSNGMEMVPYENKSLVPYEGPFDPLRKKKNRAKVVLDDETVRVWKLLMGKNGSERSESDAQKELKWEEERRKMQAQAMNFIDRMHIVMGDRSFSKWKGSVVDSVVGAFLTQNVNDVLSSSAFMSMRSRFPGRGFRTSSAESAPPAPDQDQEQSVNQSELHHPPPSPQLPQTSAIWSEVSSYPPALESIEEPRYEILAGAASTQEVGTGLELLCCPKEPECTSVMTEELSREIEVVATDSLPSHGKFNPKTGLTGLERARIEEKQVTARKDFDFSALQDEFKPRAHGGPERLTAPARTVETEDGVDWEAVRRANVAEVADVIKERGLNWILAGRIKAFLERIHLDYGTLDLEWLRAMSTDQTKDFLLSVRGLGLKSVECIRLLTLHHLAFPVDTNVGRICVRLGWVPLEPLPEELQLHLLELYPVQATIQKYLWPRLCKFDHKTLYELHYQMITFGKVFCTKTKPNCNACPMRPECKHFASALSSAKLALPASERASNAPILALPPGEKQAGDETSSRPVSQYCQPIIEEPMTPESEVDVEDLDIEDYPFSVQELIQEEHLTHQSEIHDHILSPVILEAEPVLPEPDVLEDWGCLKGNHQPGSSPNSVIEIVDSPDDSFENPNVLVVNSASQEMVLVAPETASLPVPKLKNVGRLRTVHYVYELPDNHPLLDGLDPRESDDPCTYLLAIWSPGEVPESIPNMNDSATDESGPFASSELEETIKATLLVPCRTAMRGSFPLNGTYFQVNEVFADHASSLQPMLVPRTLLWNLRRRFVFFGTSVTSIFRGMTAAEIQACFWRGYVCVRGFDQSTRAPKPLAGRLHLQAGKAKANMDV